MNWKIITSCKETSRLLSERLDHPLPLSKRILMRMHLLMCNNCVYFGRQVESLKNILGKHKLPEDELPSPYTSSLSDEAKDRIKSSMDKESN